MRDSYDNRPVSAVLLPEGTKGDNGIGAAVGNCREDVWLNAACVLAEQAVEAARREMGA